MSQHLVPDPEQFLVRLNAAVDAYLAPMHDHYPQDTKTWLAQHLSCDLTTLRHYLDGTNRLPLDTLQVLLQILGLGDDEAQRLCFLGGYPAPVVTPPPTAGVNFGTGNKTGDIRVGDVVGRDQTINIYNFPNDPASIGKPAPTTFAESEELLRCLPTSEAEPLPPPDSFTATAIPHRIALRPNTFFTGREAELRRLATNLKAGYATVIATGIGGVGKTQLATEYAHRYGRYFAGGVFWLACADPAQVVYEVAACGGTGLVEDDAWHERKLQEQVRLVREAWAAPTPRLLIFDNCEDAALIEEWRPTSGGCRILVTSRQAVWPASMGVLALPLPVLPRAESLALLGKHRPDLVPHPALDALAAEVGDLPLALHLAGSYLETYRDDPTFGDPAVFLAELRGPHLMAHEVMQGLEARHSPTSHELSVAKTFAMSLNRLDPADASDKAARALLARAAHFAPGEPIPRQVLLASLEFPKPQEPKGIIGFFNRLLRRASTPHPKDAARALQRLRGLGLIEATDGTAPRLHRLLAAYAHHACPDPAAPGAVETAVLYELARIETEDYIAMPDDLLPHLRHITDAALPRDDEHAAMLADWLAHYLQQITAYADAQPYYEQALVIRETKLGKQHYDTATSLNNLGVLLNDRGDYTTAKRHLERALKIYRKRLGPKHFYTATSLNNLGRLLQDMGDYAAASAHYKRALAIREAVLGLEHPDTAKSLNNLGNLFRVLGDYANAELHIKRALKIYEEKFGPEHSYTATSLNNLGRLLRDMGDHTTAKRHLERALEIFKTKLGPQHPATASSLNNLGMLFQDMGDYAAAQPLYERALAIWETKLGPEHPHTQTARRNLAALDAAEGRG